MAHYLQMQGYSKIQEVQVVQEAQESQVGQCRSKLQ